VVEDPEPVVAEEPEPGEEELPATQVTDTCPSELACAATTCVGQVGSGPDSQCDSEFACNLPDPCGRADFSWVEPHTIEVETPDAANCLLEALRDGQEGTFRFRESPYGYGGGMFATTVTIQVRPNRRALLTVWAQQDLSYNVTYRGPLELREASYFDACLTETEPEAILDCLDAATVDCQPE
jgi:hypothetical protein